MENINITKLQKSKKTNKIWIIAKGLRVPFQTKWKYVKKHLEKIDECYHMEMHGFPRKFPTARENATKSMVWGKSGKLITILFP